ncbi:hypothetical protein GCM10010215_36710 [Streptomyces virginiae]|uniref:Uncharacterized protein n=1 Tax=Streptomyces virginiae TaxID=1961 RepID=A0ABQ3NYP6_STRVG|nr:hypothetical protein [Streptomyces virginiae]GGQ08155.1 hypothetical protein GCM10010215_36710 [Streptomyces virginiae]GHI15679.1 hypothetical protein Scinn_51420 [Streptomyces virginiae]GHI17896.1 hypothetical protein Scinn_73590 [Streptomyces virginiae]
MLPRSIRPDRSGAGDVPGGDVDDELPAVRDTVSRVTGAPGRSFQQGAEENVHMFAEPCGRRKACGPNPVAPTPPHVRVLADWGA